MHITHRMEQFSIAYVSALAAKTGCTISEPRVDNDSIDISLYGLSPTDVTTYIRSIGSSRIGEFREKATIWQFGDAEFLVPKSRSAGDYAIRIAEMLKELSLIQQRSELEIFYDISLSGYDVCRFRNSSDETRAGTLPLINSVDFLSASRDVLLSAACSAYSAKLNYPSRKPTIAENYLRTVRMAAERGSFVLTLLAPVPPILMPSQQLTLMHDIQEEIPYAHRVTPMLDSGLRALEVAAQQASEGGDELDPFLTHAEKGLTANLCEAVAKLHDSVPGGRLEIGITWSRNRKNPPIQRPVEINRDYIPIIRQAASAIKQTMPEPAQVVRGVVTHLHKEPTDEKGKVTILDVAFSQPRRVQTLLVESEYQKALDAHRYGRDIEISGEMIKAGRSWELRNPSPIAMIDDALES